jgi:thiamine-phosphate pyrophosphorylase
VPPAVNEPSGRRAKRPIVCYITDRKAFAADDPHESLLNAVRASTAAGVDWVQVREKDLQARELLALTRAVMAAADTRSASSDDAAEASARTAPARVIVNDRLDVALAAGAAGVHLGGQSVPAGDAVAWCRGGNAPAEFLIGVSCHSLAEAQQAEGAGANYVFFGPVFETPAKTRFGAPQGIPKLAAVCQAMRIPVIAIGGVNAENSVDCLRAGASGFAAIRLFQEARDPEALREWIAKLPGSGPGAPKR